MSGWGTEETVGMTGDVRAQCVAPYPPTQRRSTCEDAAVLVLMPRKEAGLPELGQVYGYLRVVTVVWKWKMELEDRDSPPQKSRR